MTRHGYVPCSAELCRAAPRHHPFKTITKNVLVSICSFLLHCSERIEENMRLCISQSRRTIAIISQDFLRSEYCQQELILMTSAENVHKIIVILLDTEILKDSTNALLDRYFKTHTYLGMYQTNLFQMDFNLFPPPLRLWQWQWSLLEKTHLCITSSPDGKSTQIASIDWITKLSIKKANLRCNIISSVVIYHNYLFFKHKDR